MVPRQNELQPSYAQNREDIVLARALAGVQEGRYVEVGANHPSTDSATHLFYEQGWSGVTFEAAPDFAALQRAARSRDTLFEVAASEQDGGTVSFLHAAGTGLSTLDAGAASIAREKFPTSVEITVPTRTVDSVLTEVEWDGKPIHFMVIDVEGAEARVLAGTDLGRWRPWILVIESTAPNSTHSTHEQWEHLVLAAGYEFCLFDGVSRFYVHADHAAELGPALRYPACALDLFIDHRVPERQARVEELAAEVTELKARAETLEAELVRWRNEALRSAARLVATREHFDGSAGRADVEAVKHDLEREKESREQLELELESTHQTVSWRVTAPIRALRRTLARLR